MDKKKNTLRHSIIRVGIIALIIISFILSAASFIMFSRSMYGRYNLQLTNILNYVEHNADADDLKNCLQTGQKSETYEKYQLLLNSVVDNLGLAYLYIVIPNPDEGIMINAISATSAEEFAAGEDNMPLLEETDAYDEQTLKDFYTCWDKDDITFFREDSDYGYYYTACKPLKDSSGSTVALICADLSIIQLRELQMVYFSIIIGITLLIVLVFAVIVSIWIRKNITKPILELEESARDFAEKSCSAEDFGELEFNAPDIRQNNEIRSLAGTIKLMSENMKNYVRSILSAEQRAKFEKEKADDMTRIAFRDSLTHVKSKAAFDKESVELSIGIADGTVKKLAVLMADVNSLKMINDSYGHENGDIYLIGAAGIISSVYKRSPVYRVGGDEFIVILQGEDYEDRDELFDKLNVTVEARCTNMTVEPWERFSVSAGMAEFSGDTSVTVEALLKEADEIMYKNKAEFKRRHG